MILERTLESPSTPSDMHRQILLIHSIGVFYEFPEILTFVTVLVLI